MLSQTTGLSASGADPTVEGRVAKCLGRHACPPSASADFFREIANRRVKMGLKLRSGSEDQLHGIRDRHVRQSGNVQSACTSRERRG